MGISCQINTFRPADAVYHPRQDVAGVIKYGVDAPKEVLKITTSLLGIGKIILKHNSSNRETTYKTRETFVDLETIIQNTKIIIPVGSYEVKFNYTLPPNIPSTMKFKKKFKGYKVKSYIEYYICMAFKKGLFSFDHYFKKEFIVISPVKATLPREPVTLEEKKKLFQISPFSKGDSFVIITATILNSALPCSGKIIVHYAVANKSHVRIEMIKTKLVEVYTFKAKGHRKVINETEVLGTKAGQVVGLCRGDTRNISLEINVPPYIYSLENAVIATRNYFLRIIATLPLLHKDAVLDIPVQIGVIEPNAQYIVPSVYFGVLGSVGCFSSPSMRFGDQGPSMSFGEPGPSMSYYAQPPLVNIGDQPPLVNFGDPPPMINFDDPPPSVNFGDPPPMVNFDDSPPSYWEVMGEVSANEDASDDEPLIT